MYPQIGFHTNHVSAPASHGPAVEHEKHIHICFATAHTWFMKPTVCDFRLLGNQPVNTAGFHKVLERHSTAQQRH